MCLGFLYRNMYFRSTIPVIWLGFLCKEHVLQARL